MEELIYKFLVNHYEIDGDHIVLIGTESKAYCDDIQLEVIQCFDIEEDEANDYMVWWLMSDHPTFDIDSFFDDLRSPWGNLLPIAQQVSARTLGLDLVPVQPMEAPTGLLEYMDFRYEDREPEIQPIQVRVNRRTENVTQQAIDDWINLVNNRRSY
jgi:hypothetical protein